ncbi:MAG: metallophosphoesterase [Akkermansiaceae bacterium]
MKNLLLLFFIPLLAAHEGPTPLLHYSFNSRFLKKDTLTAQQGPDLALSPQQVMPTKHGLAFKGAGTTPTAPFPDAPTDTFTVTAWCSIHEGTRYGGLIGIHEDNGSFEKGWVVGYDATHFYVTLSTEKTDDGDGKLVLLRSSKPYQKNRFYYLAATYDGKELTLFINGKKDASTKSVGGKIIYPKKPRVTVAGYLDQDENYPLTGEMISAQLYRDVASAKGIAHNFQHNAELTKARPVNLSAHQPLISVIAPYLQFTTTSATTVMWETSKDAKGTLLWGETAECKEAVEGPEEKRIHEIRIKGLKPGTQYFYRTKSEAAGTDGPQVLMSEVRTFQTDGGPGTPFAFAVISDTQGNPKVSGALAQMAWSHRPNFLLHPGDLVSTGGKKQEWVGQFFASMEPLVSRVPLFPVLGNHEQNSANYYNYMSLPDPEYFYTYTYGNAQFFMVDTNKKCGPGSEQYQWLEKQLEASKATWKILCHHHPAYTSDENDYGDLWKTNKSTRGDLNARHLAHLAHKKGVDLIWNGHIHSYERTWPLQQGKPVTKDGTIHLITGGGGGHLETHGPFRNGFSQMVQRGHHYAMVWVNGTHLEYKAYTLEGLLFDSFSLKKAAPAKAKTITSPTR